MIPRLHSSILPLLLALMAVLSGQAIAQTSPWTGTPSSWLRLKFQRDYVPGTYDVNGQFMGGTATMFLTAHQGRLWAGIGYWNDLPGSDPTPGPQILVKDTFDAPWKVDFSFGTGYLRLDALKEVTFTTDRFGSVLNPPVTMLMAAVSDILPPLETTVWTRAENANVWTKTVLGSGLYARMIFDYKDMAAGPNGTHYVFAADESSALYRGGYDATAPGRLVWEPTPEITGPQRMLSAAVANGELYLGVATDGNPTNNYGGLFKRINGPNPSWQFIYEWPQTGTLGLGSNLRGLTAIPDPNGGSHQVLIGVLENLKQIVRIDPANGNAVTVELDLEAYFDGKWGTNAIFYYAAYNDMLRITDPKTGEAQHLIGVWARHPDATNTRNFNNTWYLIRHANGTYEHTQVIDPAIPIPAYPGLWAVRTIVPSPFPQEAGRVLYFGGADAGGGANPENPNTQWHNTAWIYRATRPDENMGLTKSGSSATLRLDTVHGWNYRLQYSLDLTNWINLGTAFPGNNAVQQSVQHTGTQPRVFFRSTMVRTLP